MAAAPSLGAVAIVPGFYVGRAGVDSALYRRHLDIGLYTRPPQESESVESFLAFIQNIDTSCTYVGRRNAFGALTDVHTADTDNNTLVRNYIKTTLEALNWHIEEDEFTGQTPVGEKKFTNLIATKDPAAPRRVILSAHFDSKYFPSYPANQVCASPSWCPRI